MSAEPPTTQIQCDQGEEPKAGFSIGTDHLLQYQGSSSFFACPATDSEWNIYVSPDFGQLKCVPITLTADGCGSQVSSCSVAPPSTIYQTQWTTQWATQWVTQQNYSTITVTETTIDNKTTTETETKTDTTTQLCTSSSTTASGCKKCSHKTSLGWNTTTGWNDTTSTSLCPHCTGTGTGIWTTTSTSTDTTSVVSTAPTNSVLETLTTLI